MQIDSNTRLIDMTVGDLVEIITQVVNSQQLQQPQSSNEMKGMAGIAQIFHCSIRTACRIKASGKINKAISQSGRTFVVDANLAKQLLVINS